jgi:hypothetical protein
MPCRFCHRPMAYVHGHAACVTRGCPLYGANQAECCDGETLENCPVPTSVAAAVPTRATGRSETDR